jgi:catechol 2,3-dioxygenase-like lactoylglutathione lyase family enzyme
VHSRACDVGTAHLGFLVDDLAAVVDRLRDAGVELVAPEPVRIDAGPNAGALGIYTRDPDGFIVELHQRASR